MRETCAMGAHGFGFREKYYVRKKESKAMKKRVGIAFSVLLSLVAAVTLIPKISGKEKVQAETEKTYDGTLKTYSITETYNEGWYFAPTAPGKYPGLVLMHGSGSPDPLTKNMPALMNKWVSLGYVDPMTVFIPHIQMLKEPKWGITDFGEFVSDGYCRALGKKMLDGSIVDKVDASKPLSIGGYSMGGATSLFAGAHDSDMFVNIGALSPSWCCYNGENGSGWVKYKKDLVLANTKDSHFLLSYGKGEDSQFSNNAAIYKSALTSNGLNQSDHMKFTSLDASVGIHEWAVFKREIFMFLYYCKYNALPSEQVVEAACGNGAVPAPTPAPVLPTPDSIDAVAVSTTAVKVSWSKADYITGYEVWRAESANGQFVKLGSVTDTSRKCPGLKSGKTYYFKVRSYISTNSGTAYGDFTRVVSCSTKPSTPSSVTATAVTATKIKVSWSSVNGATGYEVWRSEAADGKFVKLGTVTTTSRECPGLTSAKTYYFKVRPFIESDGKKTLGAYSSVVSAKTKPLTPANVKANASSATAVTVSWEKVNGATGYEVWRSESASGTFVKLGTVTTNSRKCPGLTTGKKYYFKVRAYITVDGTKLYGSYSSVVSAVPKK